MRCACTRASGCSTSARRSRNWSARCWTSPTPMRGRPWPRRTHMQPAMPSTVGLWAAAFAEALIDDADLVACAYRRNDRNPLGAAAGYGVPLPLDRRKVAKALGFAGVQNNVLYVNTSRGAVEAQVAEAAGRVCATLARLAWDLLLFTLPGARLLPPSGGADHGQQHHGLRSATRICWSWCGPRRRSSTARRQPSGAITAAPAERLSPRPAADQGPVPGRAGGGGGLRHRDAAGRVAADRRRGASAGCGTAARPSCWRPTAPTSWSRRAWPFP